MTQHPRARIAWRIPSTGATGHGDWMEIEIAEAWLAAMQAKMPTMEHWIEREEMP